MSAPLPMQAKFALVPGEQLLIKTGCSIQPDPNAIAMWRGTLYVTNLRIVYCRHGWLALLFIGNILLFFSATKIHAQIDTAHVVSAIVDNYVLAKKVIVVANPGGWVAFPGMNNDKANQVVAAIGQSHSIQGLRLRSRAVWASRRARAL